MENFKRIVHVATSVTLLGGGFARKSDLDAALNIAPQLICADGGANLAFDWGIKPIGIIGDLDSVDGVAAQAKNVPMMYIDNQNSTDLEKCLSTLSADLVIGVGFLGGRIDHELAALNAICKHPHKTVVLIGAEDIVFRVPSQFKVALPSDTRVSLFPLTKAQAKSVGLRWTLDGLLFSPTGQNGCSNSANGGEVAIHVLDGDIIGILPRDQLAPVVSALAEV